MSSDKFRNKYRIASARAQWWDYGNNAAYFITICTAHRENYFGKITNGKMILSEIGEIASKCWAETPQHFPFVDLDMYIVMPNHLHGIVIINKNKNMRISPNTRMDNVVDATDMADTGNVGDATDMADTGNVGGRDAINRVSTANRPPPNPPPNPQNAPTKKTGGFAGNKNPMTNDNLSHIIRWYKGRVTFESRKIHAGFAWQTRFHDHIIRNDIEFRRIACYIKNNPAK